MDGSLLFAIRAMHHPRIDKVFYTRSRAVGLLLLTLLLLLPLIATARSVRPGVWAAALQTTAACQELLTNGDLETSGGWQFGPTPAPGVVVDSPVHAGSGALRLGIATGANVAAYSTAYQSVTLPAAAEQITLTYWERPGATGDSSDYREVVVLRPNFTALRSLTRQSGAGNDQWTQRTFDLSDLAGQSIVLYFNVYNNGSGATLVNYLDDITLQSCDAGVIPSPTSPPLLTATPTLTPTLPPPTPTITPLPGGIVVRVGTVFVNAGQTSLTAPFDLLGANDDRNVGALSVDVQYDAALLKAVACTVNDNFDLLLCNLATPGVIQLAGVAADGIRAELKLADLGFDLLQTDNLNTQLMVQVDTVANADGDALSASVQHGKIATACLPGSDDCTTQTLYLPLIDR